MEMGSEGVEWRLLIDGGTKKSNFGRASFSAEQIQNSEFRVWVVEITDVT